jgi:peptidoglycan/LPS O-acetylase OafA/YrhL
MIGKKLEATRDAVSAGGEAMSKGGGRLQAVEYTRGVAAFMVMWFHFTFRLPDGALRVSGLYGYLGVEVFFVISGFIIPYSMDLRHYRIGRDSWMFMGRRIIRLEPPYLISVLLLLCVPYLAGLTPWFDGDISAHDIYRAALHLFYLVPWVGEEWMSAVYWSLAIEFQYYFLILAAAPVLLYRKNLWPQRAFFLIIMLVGYRSGDSRLVFMYLPVFGFGFIQFLFTRRGMGLWECLGWASAFAAATFAQDGTWVVGAVVALAALNAPWPARSAALWFLGTISYSLYLLHGPIGFCVDGLLDRIPDFPPALELVVQIAAALALATLFWWLIERPSTLLSKRFGQPALSPATILAPTAAGS